MWLLLMVFVWFVAVTASPTVKNLDHTAQLEKILTSINNRLKSVETLLPLVQAQNDKLDTLESNYRDFEEEMTRKFNFLSKRNEQYFDELKTHFVRKIEEMLTKRESLEVELSDAIYAMDELKSTQLLMQENLTNLILQQCSQNLTRNINKTVSETLPVIIKDNRKALISLREQINEDMNAYANKVADMNADVWKFNDKINNVLTDFRWSATLLHCEELNTRFDEYFSRIIANQKTFFENCHRLQMDEPQIEHEISDILKKLIHMIDDVQTTNKNEIRRFENLVTTHDRNIFRNLNQISLNTLSLFERNKKIDDGFEEYFKKIVRQLDEICMSIDKSKSDVQWNIIASRQFLEHELKSLNNTLISQLREINSNSSEQTKQVILAIQTLNNNETVTKGNNVSSNDTENMDALIHQIFIVDNPYLNATMGKQNYSSLITIRGNLENNSTQLEDDTKAEIPTD